jgi:hypothetical protein
MQHPFEFRIALPGDAEWAAVVRDVAIRAARNGGHAEGQATAFGHSVEEAVHQACAGPPSDGGVDCVVRSNAARVDVVITSERGSRTLTLE